ncbi:MAG: cytochrome P450 [Bauldia sp.]
MSELHQIRPSSRARAAGLRPPAPVPRLKNMGPIALLKALRTNPIECWTRKHFEEPIVLGGFAFGRVAVVSDPPAIRQILVEKTADYKKSKLQNRVLSVALKNGLLTVEGDQWRGQRRTIAPQFGKKTVMRLAPHMVDAGNAMIWRWREGGEGHVFELMTELSRLTLDALVRTIFADGLGNDAEAMRLAMVTYFETTGRIDPFDIMGLPDAIPRITRWKVRPQLRFFDQSVSALIATRKRKIAETPDAVPQDLLTILLTAKDPETGEPMGEPEVKANILTFIAAGHETTANALTWAVYLLCQSPEWYERLTVEADRELDGPLDTLADRLIETRAVIDEAMRLYPPIVGITRTAGKEDEVAGKTIRRGTLMVVSPWVLHRHQLLWDDPDLFDPDRFLEGPGKRMERYAYLPFGIGPRMCIGAAFALQEATIVLAMLMRNFTLRMEPGQTVWPLQMITLRPKDPLMMTARSRQPNLVAAILA